MATKRKPPKRKPSPKKPARKRKKNPLRSVEFDIPGRPPKPETVSEAKRQLRDILKTYEPAAVPGTIPGGGLRFYTPWLVRRAHQLHKMGPNVFLHAITALAKSGDVVLRVDDDRAPVMAPSDRRLCPQIDATGELLIWVDAPHSRIGAT